jgi:pimeloyl-ACP methyl ester carboxylesterase
MVTKIDSQNVNIHGAKIHYLQAGELSAPSVLMLHGASFRAQTWQEIGTLDIISESGYHVIAVDLPGYGNSEQVSIPSEMFLSDLLISLNLYLPVIVSPSMSGKYSLPMVVNHSEKLQGFVAVAPVGIPEYISKLECIQLPTLAIWGNNDRIVPVQQADLLVRIMPNARKVILQDAGHACYMRATDEFHEHLIEFLQSTFKLK